MARAVARAGGGPALSRPEDVSGAAPDAAAACEEVPCALGSGPLEGAGAKPSFRRAIPLFRRFWPYLRPERRLAVAFGALHLLTVPSGVISPFLVRRVFDEALPARDTRMLVLLGAGMVGLSLFAHAVGYGRQLVSIALRNRVRFRVTRELFEHALRLPLATLRKTDTGYLMSRVRDDVPALDGLMTDTLVEGAIDAFRAALFFSLLLVLDPGLAAAGLALVATVFLAVLLVSPALRRRSERAREADARASTALHEALAGIQTVRTAARESEERRRFGRAVKAAVRAAARRDVLGSATGASLMLIGAVGSYAIVAIGAYRMLHGLSTFGGIFAFFIFIVQLVGAAGSVFAFAPAVQRSLASLERIFGLLDEPRENSGAPGSRAPAEEIRGEVELREVSFRYGAAGPPALRGVTLRVLPGEVVALVGRSGAGKSTLVALLPRLFEPSEGEILLDGRPLRDYPLRWLRARIGVVPQDVFLFDRTIRENIAYATPRATDEQVREAARAAHAAEFVERLPRGYDTQVGERGTRLSGGEKQRLAIAREILRDPPILVLDEATSSLDAESEALVRDAMRRLMRGRTCFVIAHRLSTVQGADRILVLDAGRIVEEGTHAELFAKGGLYRELYERQLVGPGQSSAT
jgi:ABC-type multidrug transport system fused ATPase/permease subunit